jgi:hypothetical protein
MKHQRLKTRALAVLPWYVAGNPKIFQMPRLRLHERVCSILRAHDDAKPSLTVAGPCFPSRPSGLGTEGLEAYRGASHHH